jgi:hypothetical protein
VNQVDIPAAKEPSDGLPMALLEKMLKKMIERGYGGTQLRPLQFLMSSSSSGPLGPVYTMDHEVGPWKMAFFHGPISLENQFTKALGPQ